MAASIKNYGNFYAFISTEKKNPSYSANINSVFDGKKEKK